MAGIGLILFNSHNRHMTKLLTLTRLWHQAHSHLQPFKTALPIKTDTTINCPICQQHATLKLKVQLCFGVDNWESAEIDYCQSCEEYSFLDVLPHRLPLTAVNARLWSTSPTFLNIEPTTRCNFKCWYCVGRHMVQDDINIENFEQALINFPDLKTVALVGEGEPLMHKGFFEMANMAKARNIRVLIISNGSTLSQSIVKKLCEAEIAYVGISIDSTDAEVFAQSRIDGKLDQIWQGIERLRTYRDQHGYQYPKIGVKGTLFSYSQNELPAIIAEAKAHGVEIFESFQALNPMSTYVPIYPEQVKDELDHINTVATAIAKDSIEATQSLLSFADFCNQEGIDIDKNGTRNGLRANCDEQWVYALLSGDVTPCCQIKTPISPQWNLFTHSIDEIMQHPIYENTRFNLWNGVFPDYCSGCWKIP